MVARRACMHGRSKSQDYSYWRSKRVDIWVPREILQVCIHLDSNQQLWIPCHKIVIKSPFQMNVFNVYVIPHTVYDWMWIGLRAHWDTRNTPDLWLAVRIVVVSDFCSNAYKARKPIWMPFPAPCQPHEGLTIEHSMKFFELETSIDLKINQIFTKFIPSSPWPVGTSHRPVLEFKACDFMQQTETRKRKNGLKDTTEDTISHPDLGWWSPSLWSYTTKKQRNESSFP